MPPSMQMFSPVTMAILFSNLRSVAYKPLCPVYPENVRLDSSQTPREYSIYAEAPRPAGPKFSVCGQIMWSKRFPSRASGFSPARSGRRFSFQVGCIVPLNSGKWQAVPQRLKGLKLRWLKPEITLRGCTNRGKGSIMGA